MVTQLGQYGLLRYDLPDPQHTLPPEKLSWSAVWWIYANVPNRWFIHSPRHPSSFQGNLLRRCEFGGYEFVFFKYGCIYGIMIATEWIKDMVLDFRFVQSIYIYIKIRHVATFNVSVVSVSLLKHRYLWWTKPLISDVFCFNLFVQTLFKCVFVFARLLACLSLLVYMT